MIEQNHGCVCAEKRKERKRRNTVRISRILQSFFRMLLLLLLYFMFTTYKLQISHKIPQHRPCLQRVGIQFFLVGFGGFPGRRVDRFVGVLDADRQFVKEFEVGGRLAGQFRNRTRRPLIVVAVAAAARDGHEQFFGLLGRRIVLFGPSRATAGAKALQDVATSAGIIADAVVVTGSGGTTSFRRYRSRFLCVFVITISSCCGCGFTWFSFGTAFLGLHVIGSASLSFFVLAAAAAHHGRCGGRRCVIGSRTVQGSLVAVLAFFVAAPREHFAQPAFAFRFVAAAG